MKRSFSIVHVERRIIEVRGVKVILDVDLAELYNVQTKRLNEQVKRNRDRFPEKYMFQLTVLEKQEVVAKCDHLQRLKFSPVLPYAFTEHGTVMMATVLKSKVAVQASLLVVEAFVRFRHLLATQHDVIRRLELIEQRMQLHDADIRLVLQDIRKLRQEAVHDIQLDRHRRIKGFAPD
jgi:hypothetical protein